MAELTIKQPCTLLGPVWTKLSNTLHKSTQLCQMFVLHFTQYLAFKDAFAISARVNGGMSDWFICVQILKLGIAGILEDYTDSKVFLNFELSAPLIFPVEA
jgi:hypothetical protein